MSPAAVQYKEALNATAQSLACWVAGEMSSFTDTTLTAVAVAIFIALHLSHSSGYILEDQILPLNGIKISIEEEHPLSANGNDEVTLTEECPDPSDISPCSCYYYDGYGLGIDCSLVASVDELKRVFQSQFSSTSFYELLIQGEIGAPVPIDVLDKDTFGLVSFKTVQIRYTAIHTVQLGTFKNSYKTLESYKITDGEVYYFGFGELPGFTALKILGLSNNRIPYLPDLTAPLLETLDFHGNNVYELSSRTFAGTPKLRRIMLHQTGLDSLDSGVFSDISLLGMLFLNENNITALPVNAIAVPLSTIYSLRLSGNNLADRVVPGAISGLAGAAELHLQSTSLQVLQQEVWEPVFLQLTSADAIVYLQYNPLQCDDSIAWLLNNPTFMSRLGNIGSDAATCDDGTPLTEVKVTPSAR